MKGALNLLLPCAAGAALLALGIAALNSGDNYRRAAAERTANNDAVAIAMQIQQRLIDNATGMGLQESGAGRLADEFAVHGVTRWTFQRGTLTARPDRLLGDAVFTAQLEEAATQPLVAPLTSATGRDYVMQAASQDGGWVAVTFPADTLLPPVASEALAAESLALGWSNGAAILHASPRVGERRHRIEFPVPGGRWQLQYDSTAAQARSELRWALYVLIAVLAYSGALIMHRLQYRPRALRGDLDRLDRRFKQLNEELAAQLRNREQVQDRLYQLSVTDSETGLPNRQALTGHIETLLLEQREQPQPSPISLIVLGLRDVENAEHTLGHSVVQALLPELAKRLRADLRDVDYIARSSNYQLAVLLPDCDIDAAVAHVTTWSDAPVSGLYEHKFGSVNVAPRFGIATVSDGYGFAERLLDDAMSALTDADAATARYSVFAAERRDDRVTRLQLESDFKSAIEGNEFRLYFQPIVFADSGRPRGFECLVRWQHPTEGLLPPGRFIELGESTGLITELTRWELREAVRQAQSWDSLHRAGCYLSINLSPFDLLYPHLVSELATLVSNAGLAPSSFRLEITESMLINNVSQSRKILNEMRDAGFGVMMDDFGTGFSSLSYLRQLPFSAIKIDRSFTQAITWDSTDLGLVRNIINLVHVLDMESIIEGVETDEQYALLKTLEPVYCQGYLFAKPMTAIDAEDYLQAMLNGGRTAATGG
ncbi:MAG: EAL domain-containing protein [Woeseiaceae bacterium]|nr:EAL domain-containing protein [Woeseiaceae bacterium]